MRSRLEIQRLHTGLKKGTVPKLEMLTQRHSRALDPLARGLDNVTQSREPWRPL